MRNKYKSRFLITALIFTTNAGFTQTNEMKIHLMKVNPTFVLN